MKNQMYMTLKSLIEKHLARKQEQLKELELAGIPTDTTDKRKYIETKAVIQELENVLDIATSIFETDNDNQ